MFLFHDTNEGKKAMNERLEVEILLAEDSPHDAEMTLRALKERNLGNRVFHVTDGAEALDWIFCRGEYRHRDPNQHPKIVLLDIKMPKVDGLEVLRAIRADDRTRMLPVVVMTSSQEQSDLISSYSLGVNSYVVKPLDFDAFSAAVAELGHYWLLLNQPPHKG
jgi:two-component system, response regulator